MGIVFRYLFFALLLAIVSLCRLEAAKDYSLKNKDGKVVEFSVVGLSPHAVYVEAKNGREFEIDWDSLDLEWLDKNSKELLDAREYSQKIADKRKRANETLEKLKKDKDPVAVTGTVLGVLPNGAVIMRSRGVPPKGELARAMTSRTKVASGLCCVENIPDMRDVKTDQYYEVIAYESGEFEFRASFWEDTQIIKKYFARDDRRVSIFDKGKRDYISIEEYLERDTNHNKAHAGSILVHKPISTGSGYMVKGGFVITAFHVVDGAKKISVNFNDTYHAAEVAAKNKGLDVAILKIEGLDDGMPLKLSTSPRIGEEVFSLGYPNTQIQGSSIKYTSGDINALSGLRDDENFMQISVPLQPGNSGGPLFDLKGNFLGVVVSRLSDSYSLQQSGYVPQNVNYASKAKNLWALLKQLKIESLEPSSQERKKADIIEDVQNYCVFIRCER